MYWIMEVRSELLLLLDACMQAILDLWVTQDVPDIIPEPCEGPFPKQSASCLNVTTYVMKQRSALQERSNNEGH